MNKMDGKGISVLICCYNSENIIKETLTYLNEQEVDDSLNWEILVIDNASNDNTAEVAGASWNYQHSNAKFKVLREPKPGKINALKKGLHYSENDLILICDDDNFLNRRYVQTAYSIMHNNPEVGFLGGHGIPRADVEFPNWFEDFKHYYGCGSQSKNGHDITYEKEYVYGAGSVFRKSIFDNIPEEVYFRTLPGRKGNNLVGAEDNIMGYVAVIKGYKIWYIVDLLFYHKIPKNRLQWDYLLNLSYSNGRAEIYLDPFTNFIREKKSKSGWIEKIWISTKHILSLLKRDRLRLFFKKEGSTKDLRLYYYLGKITELIRLNFSYKKEYEKSISYCKSIKAKEKKHDFSEI